MKNDNSRGTTELRGTLTRAVRLLEYLRKNTDKDHPISQTALFSAGGDDHIFGTRKTIAKNVVVLANALNIDKYNGLKPEEDWRLRFRGFDDRYANGSCDSDDNSDDDKISDVMGIYFNHIFSEDELTAIINALNTSKAVSKTQTEIITGKLMNDLASKYYKPPVYKLDFSEPTDGLPGADPAQLSGNIAFIQKAIGGRHRISFVYNKINGGSKGRHKLSKKLIQNVSPYYIVCENGRLFLYGAFENKELCVLRIDLMEKTALALKGKRPIPSLEKNIVGLGERDSEFKARHLFASYDNDRVLTTFEWSCRDEDTGEFICTALYGAFGDEFSIDKNGLVNLLLIHKDENCTVKIDFYVCPRVFEFKYNDVSTYIDIDGKFIFGSQTDSVRFAKWLTDVESELEEIVWEWHSGKDEFKLISRKVI